MLQLSCDERFSFSCAYCAAQWRCWSFGQQQQFWHQPRGRECCRACGRVGPRTWPSLDFVSCCGSSFGCCSCCCSCFDSSSSFLHPDQFQSCSSSQKPCCSDGHDGAAQCWRHQKRSCRRPSSDRSDPWLPRRWGWG